MHAQQTRVACTARERSEMEAKESPQAQIAKLQQQLQELQVRYAAECKRSEQLELAVRNKDLQLAELQSADKEARPTGLGEVNKAAKERPHWDEQNDSDGSGMPSEGSSASTFSKMDPSDDVPNFPKDSVLRTQSADVEVACGQLFPLLLDFLPVDEVVRFNIRAVSRFFASPKAWVFHLFKLTDIDSLPTSSSEKQMHPVVECFHKCRESEKEGPKTVERRARLIREYLLGTSERCRGFILWMYNLHRWRLYQPDLVHHFIDVCLEVLDYQLVEPPANVLSWMASLLHGLYPWPELRLRIARRMIDVAGVAKKRTIVRTAMIGICKLEPVCQCIDRHFLAEFVRIMTSDEALLSPCFHKATNMADFVLADDLACLVAFRRLLRRALLNPEMLSEVRHELLELLAGWPGSGCGKRFRLGQDGGLRWGTSSCWNVNSEINSGLV